MSYFLAITRVIHVPFWKTIPTPSVLEIFNSIFDWTGLEITLTSMKLCLKFVNATSYQIDVGYLPRYENSKVIIGRWGKMRPRSLPTKIKSGRPRLQYAGGSAVIAKLELSCDSIRLSEWCLADGALKTCFISVIWISITHFHPSNAIYWEQLREEVSHVSPHAHREMGVVSVITILWHSVGGGRARGRRPIPSSSSVEILPWDLYEALVYRVEKKGL